jgi:PAS domain S-box-containing protein
MLLVADLEGKFLSLTPAWTTTLGWSEDDLIGRTYAWLVHPDDRDSTDAEVARLARGNVTRQFENRHRHKDGSFRWLSWTAALDRDRIYAVARDVTGIKAAEEELRSSRQELARVGRFMTMGAMTASIAHELNQPLAAIGISARPGCCGFPESLLKRTGRKQRSIESPRTRCARRGLFTPCERCSPTPSRRKCRLI